MWLLALTTAFYTETKHMVLSRLLTVKHSVPSIWCKVSIADHVWKPLKLDKSCKILSDGDRHLPTPNGTQASWISSQSDPWLLLDILYRQVSGRVQWAAASCWTNLKDLQTCGFTAAINFLPLPGAFYAEIFCVQQLAWFEDIWKPH